jgi:3-dehydroquinate synthase
MSNGFSVKSRIRDYRVEFVDDFARDVWSKRGEGDFLIIDEKIKSLYGEKLEDLFDRENILTIEANEENKTLTKCEEIIEYLIGRNIRKKSAIFAIGGGVIQDISSFVSMVLFRGIEWYFYPTTLLAQSDSCIGSKSSINFGKYKNLLGSFYPPAHIGIDMGFLTTLPEDEIRSGMGEILHFYLIAGKEDLAKKMMNEYDDNVKDPGAMEEYILQSLMVKKSLIEEDEFDKGKRNIFNYGHTFGHAIESVTSYAINHGQAVTMGMDMANYISNRLGHIDDRTFDRMHAILKKNMPDFKLSYGNISDYFKALSKDKKNEGANVGCILTKGPGHMFKEQLPMDEEFKNNITSYFDRGFLKREDA